MIKSIEAWGMFSPFAGDHDPYCVCFKEDEIDCIKMFINKYNPYADWEELFITGFRTKRVTISWEDYDVRELENQDE